MAFDPKKELSTIPVDDVWNQIRAQGTGMLVVTGGEPLLQQRSLAPIFEMAKRGDWIVEVETAGTVVPTPEVANLVDRFNVSPKLSNSGNAPEERIRGEALVGLQRTSKAAWKFVVTDPADLAEIAELTEMFGLSPIWIMPEGTTSEGIDAGLRDLAQSVLDRGWNLTTRLQVAIWGNQRGV